MNYDNFVNFIVEEIYKKINNIECEIFNKPKAVTIFEKDNTRFDLLKNDFDIVEFDKTIKDCEIVIVSRLCMRGLSNLASGNSTSDEERFILKMLMKGKKVYVLDDGVEYKKYKETAPKALYKKFMSFEDEICKFGIQIIKDLKNISLYYKQSIKKENTKSLNKEVINKENLKIDDDFSLDLRHKKLISEADLKRPAIKGVKNILVSKKSIITPLATDFLRIHHLKLKKM